MSNEDLHGFEKELLESIMDTPKPKTKETYKMNANFKALIEAMTETRSSGTGKWHKIPVGKSKVRILPAKEGEDLFLVNKQHYINNTYYECSGEGCPICKRMWELWREAVDAAGGNKEAGKPILKKYGTNQSVLVNVLTEGEVKVLSLNKSLADKLVAAATSEDLCDFADPEKGYDFIIDKSDGPFPKYDNSEFARKPSSIENFKEIMAKAHNLQDFKTKTDLKKLLTLVGLMD